MKRIVSLLLALTICIGLCACGSAAEPTESPTELPTEAPTEPLEPTVSPEELARQAAYHEKMAAVFAEKLEGVIPSKERWQFEKNIKFVEIVSRQIAADKPLEIGEGVFTDIHLDPKWAAVEPEEVRFVVDCTYGISEKGWYPIGGGKAYQYYVAVEIRDLAACVQFEKEVFHGSEPPETVSEPGDHYGSEVDEAEIQVWIASAIEEKMPQIAKKAIEEVEYGATERGYSPKRVFDELSGDFSDAMIEYALEHCNVDWRGNALLAVEKPPYTTYSREKIIRELVEDGYTEEDAVYAADNCNADWNERCCRKVKLYLEDDATYNDSREWLTRDLKDYGMFTEEEIEYALEQCGVK